MVPDMMNVLTVLACTSVVPIYFHFANLFFAYFLHTGLFFLLVCLFISRITKRNYG